MGQEKNQCPRERFANKLHYLVSVERDIIARAAIGTVVQRLGYQERAASEGPYNVPKIDLSGRSATPKIYRGPIDTTVSNFFDDLLSNRPL
jgi:hypothetical protein